MPDLNNLVIPPGKQLYLRRRQQGEDDILVPNTMPLILEEPITITLSSDFGSLFGDVGNGTVDAIGGLFRGLGFGFSSQFKQFSIQTWKGTEPLSFKCTCSFHIGQRSRSGVQQWGQRTSVYQPINELLKIPLPFERELGNLVPPGPSLLDVAEDTEEGIISNSGVASNFFRYSLQIGKLYYLPSVVVKVAQPTYSEETDEFGNPLSAKIELDFITTVSATQQLIDSRYYEG
jgi:hypothetical protein